MSGKIQIWKEERHALRRAQWTIVATRNPMFVDPPSRLGINPASGKPFQMVPPPDYRALKIEDEFVGLFEWSTYEHLGEEWGDDLGFVDVSWDEKHEAYVKAAAKKITTEMNADFAIL